MSLVLPLLLMLGGADPAPAPTPPETTTATTATEPATVRVLLLPVGGDVSDVTRGNLDRTILARFKRFSGLVIVPAVDDGGCGGAEDRPACLQELLTRNTADVVVATSASAAGGDATVTMLVLHRDGSTLAETTSSMSRMDGGTITDAATKTLRATADALHEKDPDHFSEGDVTTRATTTTTTTTTTKLDQDAVRQGLLLGGGVGLGIGVLAIVCGAIPGVLAGQATGQLTTLRNDYVKNGGDPATLEEARAQQKTTDGYVAAHNAIGVPVLWTGVVVTVLGGAALAAAVFALPATAEEAPSAAAGSTP